MLRQLFCRFFRFRHREVEEAAAGAVEDVFLKMLANCGDVSPIERRWCHTPQHPSAVSIVAVVVVDFVVVVVVVVVVIE